MHNREKPRKAAGTYGFADLLRRPSRIFRPATPSEAQQDIGAVRRGEARMVSCFLRGDHDPLPRRLTQGTLQLSATRTSWTRFWSLRRTPIAIPSDVLAISTRSADYREPNVKKGGKAFGVLPVPAFVVVTCNTTSGSMDLVVPAADVPLVTSYFRDHMRSVPD